MDTPLSPEGHLAALMSSRTIAETARVPARSASALDRPVFVIGCPRSGTTLVGRCLAAHPQLAGAANRCS